MNEVKLDYLPQLGKDLMLTSGLLWWHSGLSRYSVLGLCGRQAAKVWVQPQAPAACQYTQVN